MVVVAVLALNTCHPAFCFDAEFEDGEGRKGMGMGLFNRQQQGMESKGMETEFSVGVATMAGLDVRIQV